MGALDDMGEAGLRDLVMTVRSTHHEYAYKTDAEVLRDILSGRPLFPGTTTQYPGTCQACNLGGRPKNVIIIGDRAHFDFASIFVVCDKCLRPDDNMSTGIIEWGWPCPSLTLDQWERQKEGNRKLMTRRLAIIEEDRKTHGDRWGAVG